MLKRAILFLLAALFAAPAFAQVPPGQPTADAQRSPLPPGVGTEAELREREETGRVREAVRTAAMTERQIRVFTQSFARCTVDRRRDNAIAVVDEMMTTDHIQRRFRLMLHGDCFPSATPTDDTFVAQAQFPFPTLHVALADALVRALYTVPGPTDFAAVPSQVRLTRAGAAAAVRPADAATDAAAEAEVAAWWFVLERFGECVARRMPEQVRQLAFTDVASPEERAALQTLQPVFGACLPPGATMRLRPADVRGSSLLAYYRLAQAAAGAAPVREAAE